MSAGNNPVLLLVKQDKRACSQERVVIMLVETKREQVFQISPSVRVVADYEQDYETIGEVANNIGIGVQTLHYPSNFRSYSTDDEIGSAIQGILSNGVRTRTEAEAQISKYLTDNGIPFVITCLKGLSQSEWHDMVIYSPSKDENAWTWSVEQLQGITEHFDALFAGEVYRVSVENAKVFTANDGETRTEWITDEAFGFTEVVEKLFTLNADWIKDTFNLEVVVEVEG